MRTNYLLRIKKESKETLQQYAKEQGVSLNGLVNIILTNYLKQIEKEIEHDK